MRERTSASAATAAARKAGAGLAGRARNFARGPWLKPLVFLAALAPFAALVQGVFGGSLGPDPVEALTDHTGTLATRFLLFSLALTPLRWLLGDVWPIRLRRMLGLFAFFYAVLHVSVYAVLDRELDLSLVLEDLTRRPYVMAGFLAFVILVPLAVTSTRRLARRLGRHWTSLHRWVYIAAAAAIVHGVLLARGDVLEPFVYLAVLVALLGWRLARVAGTSSSPAAARR